jgi:small GTP-binding protein
MSEIEYHLKILIIGESRVGKTCLLLRFTDDIFTEHHVSTIGIDFKTKIMTLNNKNIKMQLWDTAGQERFKTLTKNFYKSADGIVLVYDITDESSFKNVRTWMKQIDEFGSNKTCRILVGNKCDKEESRKVSYEEGQTLAQELNLSFFEASAKENLNVEEVFTSLAKNIMKDEGNLTKIQKNFYLTKENDKKKKIIEKCCK